MWSEAFQLAKVEIRKSILFILLSWLFFVFIGLVILAVYNLAESGDRYHDMLFIMLLVALPLFFRRKVFRAGGDDGKVTAAPVILHYNELPIPKKIIAHAHLFISAIYCLPASLVLFLFAYMMDSVFRTIPFGSYIVFLLCLLAISYVMGLLALALDYGAKMTFLRAIGIIIVSAALLYVIKLVDFTYETAFLIQLLDLVIAYPLYIASLSVLLTLLSIWLFPSWIGSKLRKKDF